MKHTKVYDEPTRLFHWLFAGLFIGAFAIAKLFDDESSYFPQHMLLGMLLTYLTLLRLFWGILGSKYARFSSYPLKPRLLLDYFRNFLTSKDKPHLGHNPASAWAAILMMALALGLGTTGYLMSIGSKEVLEDVHELFANAFVFVVVAHVAGVALHHFRHRDNIGMSMLHGKKMSETQGEGITRSHRIVALGLAGLMGVFAFQIYSNYDSNRATTSLFGVTLQLGENEADKHGEAPVGEEGEGRNGKHENDDD